VSGTPSPSSPLNVVTGSSATVAVTFITNDGYPASNLSVNLAGLPAGWSATSSGTCATVSSATTCLLNLSYMPTVPTTGAPTLELPFTYTNNSGTVENGTTFAITYTAVAP
jgi:hypothetical protein